MGVGIGLATNAAGMSAMGFTEVSQSEGKRGTSTAWYMRLPTGLWTRDWRLTTFAAIVHAPTRVILNKSLLEQTLYVEKVYQHKTQEKLTVFAAIALKVQSVCAETDMGGAVAFAIGHRRDSQHKTIKSASMRVVVNAMRLNQPMRLLQRPA